ncbi:hypothetical protein HWV00_05385 [Moritella sp. 24]|uniref:hypothetical protein n=1 Tax=Moritella sp. 24 TaxID=2746230 RepID=UPI001BAAEAD4|nr:hypothetical protein [Moritella sp. 24]QUM75713.1 hypothetical protein HWV00_05385 [Moritella sp. 24]
MIKLRDTSLDVRNLDHERLCKNFADQFSYQNSNENISFSRIDTKKRSILTLSTQYGWHLQYWDSGLYRRLDERLNHGIHLWDMFSDEHCHIARSIQHNTNKVDICTQHGHHFELFSFTSNKYLSPALIMELGQLKPKVSKVANKIWLNEKNITLPFYENKNININKLPTLEIEGCNKIRFGDVILTSKEMATIHCLLELKSIKEIARFHHCSEANERKRINVIKEKFSCENLPLSFLFNALKTQGVTLACLDAYIMSH